jgi:hypothetical protein
MASEASPATQVGSDAFPPLRSRSHRSDRRSPVGHEDQFPPRRLNVCYRFSQMTFAGTSANVQDAPIPDLRPATKGGRGRAETGDWRGRDRTHTRHSKFGRWARSERFYAGSTPSETVVASTQTGSDSVPAAACVTCRQGGSVAGPVPKFALGFSNRRINSGRKPSPRCAAMACREARSVIIDRTPSAISRGPIRKYLIEDPTHSGLRR